MRNYLLNQQKLTENPDLGARGGFDILCEVQGITCVVFRLLDFFVNFNEIMLLTSSLLIININKLWLIFCC